ncbi:MAG: hypothetical protein HY700_05550 [Gemmatimonadetes bacterium]|nr:hypothetical protein [Gemmatimonadota bacterium]
MPGVVGSPDPARALAAYADLYLREEVQSERLVRRAIAAHCSSPVLASRPPLPQREDARGQDPLQDAR